MNYRIVCFASMYMLLANVFFANLAWGVDKPEVRVAPAPDWVESITFSEEELIDKSAISDGEYYILLDEQVNALKSKSRFRHYAIKLLNETAVEENSRISVTFDPSFQSVTMHGVTIWRDGEPIRHPVKQHIKLLQREKQLENLIYDGRWTATLLLEDIRKGDILDYSFTVSGQNPAYKGNVSEIAYVQWTVPVERRVYRLLWPERLPVTITGINNIKDKLDVIDHAGYTEYLIDLKDYPTRQVDNEAPDWFDPWTRIAFSSVSSWEEVSTWAEEFFKTTPETRSQIEHIASQIRNKYSSRMEQASAALRYVQDEIRYVGIEIGVGGLVPSLPGETLKRRYGDCKDKTYLLLSILDALGIEAYPALANTDYGETLAEDGPRLAAFNHVLVKAIVDENPYWLETTINNQGGLLDGIFQPDYGMVLVIKPGGGSLASMSTEHDYDRTVYNETFDLTSGVNEPAGYTIETVLTGGDAESLRRTLNSKGKKQLFKEYLDYYSTYYKDISFAGETQILDERALNRISITEKYKIADIWEENEKKQRYIAPFYNNAVYAYIDTPDVIKRNSPYKFSHPVNVEQNITVLLPESWSIKNDAENISTPFFDYTARTTYSDNERKLQLHYKFKTHRKSIPANKIEDFIAAIEDVNQNTQYRIYYPYSAANSIVEENALSAESIVAIVLLVVIILLGYSYIEFRINQKRSPDPGTAKYYPVSLEKILVLSFSTFGLYLVYWFYKNWKYVKTREQSSIIPWGRAFFYTLWYYPLYLSIIRESDSHPPEKSKSSNFSYGLLAIAFFILWAITNSVEHPVSYLTLLLAVACVVPIASRINQLTPESNACFQFNSRWRPRHFVFIFLFLLIASLDVTTRINLIPSETVVHGESIWDRDIRYMRRIGVLSPDEHLLLFYSNAFFSFKEDGNGLTDKGVFSYWRDEDTGEVYIETAEFDEIEKVKYDPEKDKSGTIVIERKDNSSFVVYTDHGAKLDFHRQLIRHWKNATDT